MWVDKSYRLSAVIYLLFFCLGISPGYAADHDAVPLVSDLQTDASQARNLALPLLMIVSQTDCPYCEKLKQAIILPMLRSGEYQDKVIIRELMIDDASAIRDFDGQYVYR